MTGTYRMAATPSAPVPLAKYGKAHSMGLTIALIASSLASEANAAAIGLPDNTARIGYTIGLSRAAIDDPAGATKADVGVKPITLIYTDWLRSGMRYWAEAYYSRFDLEADASNVGQGVSRLGVRLLLQRNVHLGQWSPWLGAGVDLSQNRYSNRHTQDNDGFLLNAYADRSETAVGIHVHVVNEWTLTRNWDLIGKAEQLISISGGVTESALSVGVLYRY